MSEFVRIFLVALGSAAGGVGRYLVSSLTQLRGGFPVATLAINVLGSLAIGVLSGFLARGNVHAEAIRAFGVVGFCGGFTTFSTFSNETFKLFEAGRYGSAAAYVLISVLAGLIAVAIGYALSRSFSSP